MHGALTFFLTVAFLAFAQDAPAPAVKVETPEFFSGTVTAITPTQITVHRKALASNSTTKLFAIDAETKIEGKPRVSGNVTVQYSTGDDGTSRAIHIIVR